MSSFRLIIALFKKDLLLEVRQQYSFYGILLYIGATIFVLFMAVDEPESRVWNGLFWVIQLFICINAVAKSFLQESKGRMLYFYSVASPADFVLAKLVFTFLAAIAAKAQQNAAIMAVLGFPLIIPQLLLLMRLSNAAFSPLLTIPMNTVLLLVALDVMIILLAVILFPFLWKD